MQTKNVGNCNYILQVVADWSQEREAPESGAPESDQKSIAHTVNSI